MLVVEAGTREWGEVARDVGAQLAHACSRRCSLPPREESQSRRPCRRAAL